MFHEQVRQEGAGEGGPLGRSGPHVHVGSEAGAAAGAEHKAISMGVAAGVEHEAACNTPGVTSLFNTEIEAGEKLANQVLEFKNTHMKW